MANWAEQAVERWIVKGMVCDCQACRGNYKRMAAETIHEAARRVCDCGWDKGSGAGGHLVGVRPCPAGKVLEMEAGE